MDSPIEPTRIVGRYALFAEIASGGMATVHLGRLTGAVGFSRTVAVKRLHLHFAKDPEFVSMFLDEARLAARIRHPNVVPTLDVVAIKGELFLVMEYVHGETLSRLIRASAKRGTKIPPRIVVTIMVGVLHGLHAAHQAKSELGQPLGIVHRDVSPQNVLVGTDGVARVLDFGIAKAAGRLQTTRTGQLKGKLPYMAPEQILAGAVSPQTDIYSASVVIWEALTGRRLFPGNVEAHILRQVLHEAVEPPSKWVPDLPPILDELTLRGLRHDPSARYVSAREMAIELERALQLASSSEIGEWVEGAASKDLLSRAELVSKIECYTPENVSSMSNLIAPGCSSDPPTATMQFPPQTAIPNSPASTHESEVPTQSAVPTPPELPLQRSFLSSVTGTLLLGLLLGFASIAVVSFLYDPASTTNQALAAGNTAMAPEPEATPPETSTPTYAEAPPMPTMAEPPTTPTEVKSQDENPTAPKIVRKSNTARARPLQQKARPAANETRSVRTSEDICSPPFTLDALGVRHIKPECL